MSFDLQQALRFLVQKADAYGSRFEQHPESFRLVFQPAIDELSARTTSRVSRAALYKLEKSIDSIANKTLPMADRKQALAALRGSTGASSLKSYLVPSSDSLTPSGPSELDIQIRRLRKIQKRGKIENDEEAELVRDFVSLHPTGDDSDLDVDRLALILDEAGY